MPALLSVPFDHKTTVPFVQSAREVFSTMTGLATKVGKPYLKMDDSARHEVSGIIGFSGNVEGTLLLGLRTSTAVKLAEAFTGSRLDPYSADFADAVGELTNMIAGSAKKDLGSRATITMPTVIVGNDHQSVRLNGVPCVVIPCSTDAGEFVIEVNIKVNL